MSRSTFEKTVRVLILAMGIALTACLVSLVTLLVSGMKPGIFEKGADGALTDEGALSSRLGRTPDYGQNYINNIIFVGDRTISGMKELNVLEDGLETRQIWTGESGDLSLDYSIDTATVVYPEDGTSISIPTAAGRKKTAYVVITLGINNGVAYCTEEKFKEYYGKLIDGITESSPETGIILQSVLPISKSAEKELSGVTNDKIDTANRWIEELAEEKSVRYLNTASALKNSKGALDEKYDSGDGVTLNEAGYLIMLDYIRTHGYQ